MGLSKKNNWIEVFWRSSLQLKDPPSELPGEKALGQIGAAKVPEKYIDKNELRSTFEKT